jgi:hypothetical protein
MRELFDRSEFSLTENEISTVHSAAVLTAVPQGRKGKGKRIAGGVSNMSVKRLKLLTVSNGSNIGTSI